MQGIRMERHLWQRHCSQKDESMGSGYDDLKKGFEERVDELQASCPHTKTEWVEEYWAFGHSTGAMIHVCLNCNKILGRKDPEYGVNVL